MVRGNCYDNAVVESFFSSLKNEIVHHRDYGIKRGVRYLNTLSCSISQTSAPIAGVRSFALMPLPPSLLIILLVKMFNVPKLQVFTDRQGSTVMTSKSLTHNT
jgi:hypothetical protein